MPDATPARPTVADLPADGTTIRYVDPALAGVLPDGTAATGNDVRTYDSWDDGTQVRRETDDSLTIVFVREHLPLLDNSPTWDAPVANIYHIRFIGLPHRINNPVEALSRADQRQLQAQREL